MIVAFFARIKFLLIGVLVALIAGYFWGRFDGRSACLVAAIKAQEAAIDAHNKRASQLAEIDKQTAVERAGRQEKQRIVTREVIKYVETNSNPSCSLDTDGLRIWNAANKGDSPISAGGTTPELRGTASARKRKAE